MLEHRLGHDLTLGHALGGLSYLTLIGLKVAEYGGVVDISVVDLVLGGEVRHFLCSESRVVRCDLPHDAHELIDANYSLLAPLLTTLQESLEFSLVSC